MYKNLKSRLTMIQTGEVFTDMSTSSVMYYWVDCYGCKWIAEARWGSRVKINK